MLTVHILKCAVVSVVDETGAVLEHTVVDDTPVEVPETPAEETVEETTEPVV